MSRKKNKLIKQSDEIIATENDFIKINNKKKNTKNYIEREGKGEYIPDPHQKWEMNVCWPVMT